MPAEPEKLNFLYTNFWPNYPCISILFLIEKHIIFSKLSVFYNNLLKLHPISNSGSFISDENLPIAIPNFTKKHFKGRHIYVYHVNVNPPPPPPPGKYAGHFPVCQWQKSSFTIWPNPDTIIVEKSEVKNGIRECAALKTPFSLPLDCSLKTPIQNFSVSQTLISPGITILWKICIAKPHNWGKFSSKTSYWVKKVNSQGYILFRNSVL